MKDRKEYFKKYYQQNKEKYKVNHDYSKVYRQTKMGRASNLLGQYKRLDREADRGEGDLTAKWIVENIFTKPCAHCGKEGWDVIGCNRLDNTKPHTKNNVEPCCYDCNLKLANAELRKTVYQYTLDGELINAYESISNVKKYNHSISAVSDCCNGKRNTHHGCKWSFVKLT